MPPRCMTVFLPCRTLDDFPGALAEAEAGDLLDAWTSAWHPALVAAAGSAPSWSSVDLPPPRGPILGIVPASWDDRFAAQFDAASTGEAVFVRGVSGAEPLARAAADGLGLPAGPLPGAAWADDFRALGLAALLAELLARRMRTQADLAATGFPEAVVTAATAAVAGDDSGAEEALARGFDALAATRARYYPVDSYAVDLVLAAPAAAGPALLEAVDSPVPVTLVTTAATVASIAAASPAAIDGVRRLVAAGRVEIGGGRLDDSAVDRCTPEGLLASFVAGIDLIRGTLGAAPASFVRIGGGATPLLVQVLAGLGFEGGLWTLFDGGPLPDAGDGIIRWEAAGAAIDLLAACPLDAGSARAVLSLPAVIGDALDHHHVAAVAFAHYPGAASRWHPLVRRIGRRTNLLGTFVTPRELARRTGPGGTPVAPEPDAFPPSMPAPDAVDDPIPAAVAAAAAEAAAIVAAVAPFTSAAPRPSVRERHGDPVPRRRWLPFPVTGRAAGGDRFVLDNGLVRVEIHPRTGGVLAVRRGPDGPNRLSQQLSIRSSRTAAGAARAGDDGGSVARMVADTVERSVAADGGTGIVSIGRLVAAGGDVAARFTQRVGLADGLPLALLDLDVRLERPLRGPLLDDHAVARFAWHENEQVNVRRSLLTQAVVTERTRFVAPHFVEIVPRGGRFDPRADAVAILTGGLPWHILSTPHVLDSLLAGGGSVSVTRRLAIGLGLQRPWDAALSLLAGGPLDRAVAGLPDHVRLTACDTPGPDPDAVRVGLLESEGRAGDVSVDWGRPVARATAVDFAGRPIPGPAVAIDGCRTVVCLAPYQWLQLALGFTG